MIETFSELVGYFFGSTKEEDMNATLQIDAISVSTRELYDNFMDCSKDMFWDNVNDNNNINDDFIKIARGLATGNTNSIRRAFVDGYTVMMMGGKMERLENMAEKEVRVYHNETLVCVLVDQEIQY